ncbi:MAG: hypothetical protein UT33_C0011G0180 [Candidatus Peregrinibacteria bacterium GW2011_GWC2_39_14]|nr:MAG: hypothetical protein UT33_C0011G0180 [Candidatus Peregrinibacteria bacterium GW2011_GWC2_39_14]
MGRGVDKPKVDKDLTFSTADAVALQKDLAVLADSLAEMRSKMRDRELDEIDRELIAERAREEKKALDVGDEDDDLDPVEMPDMALGSHPRAVTLMQKLLTKLNGRTVRILESGLDDVMNALRPKKRGDCELRNGCAENDDNRKRPCTWVGCSKNLYLDVNPETGSIKLNFPDLNPWEMHPRYSCALDIADDGGWPLERVGGVMNLTRERIRQYEVACIKKLRQALVLGDLVVSDEPDIELNVEDGDDSVVVNDEKGLAKAGVAVLAEGADGDDAVKAAAVDVAPKPLKAPDERVSTGSDGEGDDVFDIGELEI